MSLRQAGSRSCPQKGQKEIAVRPDPLPILMVPKDPSLYRHHQQERSLEMCLSNLHY